MFQALFSTAKKATMAFISTTVGAAAVAFIDGSITREEIAGAVAVGIAAAIAVFKVKNTPTDDPKKTHQVHEV